MPIWKSQREVYKHFRKYIESMKNKEKYNEKYIV